MLGVVVSPTLALLGTVVRGGGGGGCGRVLSTRVLRDSRGSSGLADGQGSPH